MENKVLELRVKSMVSILNERQKRLYLALEAESYGWGGMGVISGIAGVDKDTITAGKKELEALRKEDAEGNISIEGITGKPISGFERIRKEGGGRKSVRAKQPGIIEALLRLVDEETYGDPCNPLSWTTKSTRNLADELAKEGFTASHTTVKELLQEEGYSLQGNRKMLQVGESHVDRDAQFTHINTTAKSYMKEGQPVISVDCKKKENVGNFAGKGKEYAKKGCPVAVLDHDFYDAEKGKAIPYGTYDIANNEGYVNVGISHDTASFAVNSISAWWTEMGQQRFPNASRLYITADGGGSNGSRNRLWKVELQNLADKTGLTIEVSHFPPGTSKWNKIEHRLFSQISKNWRGRPLKTLEIIVNLIASTSTEKGLKVGCGVDNRVYNVGTKISDKEMDNLRITRNEFHGEWNYTIVPR